MAVDAPKADLHRLDAQAGLGIAVPVDPDREAARRADRRAARIVVAVHEAALAGDDPASVADAEGGADPLRPSPIAGASDRASRPAGRRGCRRPCREPTRAGRTPHPRGRPETDRVVLHGRGDGGTDRSRDADAYADPPRTRDRGACRGRTVHRAGATGTDGRARAAAPIRTPRRAVP